MPTTLLSAITLDQSKLELDLALLTQMQMFHMYDQVTCSGHFRSCTIFNHGINTANGDKVKYIISLLHNNFFHTKIIAARIFTFTPNSVMMPHIDHLTEFSTFVRIHIPLKTNKNCFHSEHDTVYQMRLGEIWHLNTRTPHSAACLGSEERIHLVIDINSDLHQLIRLMNLKHPNEYSNIDQHSLIKRLPYNENMLGKLYQLSDIIDENNFYDIFSIVIKYHYKIQSNILQVYEWMQQIANMSQNSKVIQLVQYWRQYCLTPRS
jgi:hypothetical protein